MFRVIYKWTVAPEKIEAFEASWREATRAIHQRTPGALGSFCLQSVEDETDVLTVALWESEAHWRAFIPTAKATSMKSLHAIADQVAVMPYTQLGDETVSA